MKTIITALFPLILITYISLNAQTIGTGLGRQSIAGKADGTVYTWGYNSVGQLGNGNTGTNSNVPVAVVTSGVLSGKTITQVAGGLSHLIALASDGTVYTWGYNFYGQLGNGNTGTNSNVPVAVDVSGVLNGKTITQVAAGLYHSIALASDGTVYTWGLNNNGQLGNGINTSSNVPVAVDMSGVLSGKTITQVAGGSYHSIALASDGTVYIWGYNNYGQLGNGNTGTNSNVPVAVTTSGVLSGKTITQVAGGEYHSIALASDGTVYTWGRNYYGQLGNGSNTNSNVPVAVTTNGVLSGKTITQVAGGLYHSIVLASDGTVYTWGYNIYGQLGNGNTGTDSNVPVAVVTSGVLSGKTITNVAGGLYHSIVLASDGTVYTWGYNVYGQLGNGNTGTNSNVPAAVDQSGIGPLPVELTTFSFFVQDKSVILTWKTATEVNNYGFEIERSVGSKQSAVSNWERIGFISGAGNTNSPKDYSFVDKGLTTGKYFYRLKQIDTDGSYEYSDVVEVDFGQPNKFELKQNYPNPFNPSTKISYTVPQDSKMRLTLFNALGQELRMLEEGYREAGSYSLNFDATGMSSGIYFYKLEAGSFHTIKKMILLK